jgi:hypothetical protein
MTDLQPSMSRLFKQYGILNVSQIYRPTLPVMGIALFYFFLIFNLIVMYPVVRHIVQYNLATIDFKVT